MEMHQARYFVALCETLNFTRAAEKCNVTQPSLTRAIKLLEEELGGPLFNRERNQTHLTELGRMMEGHLREVIEQAQLARSRAASFFSLHQATLKLGIARGISLEPVETTLRGFIASCPETEITLHDERSSDLREALRRGEFEVVLLPERAHDLDDLHYHRVGEARLCAILPDTHALAASTAISLMDLSGAPLICGDGCPLWEAAARAFAEAGIAVAPKATAGRREWLYELVSAGVGIGVGALQGPLPPGLVARPVTGAVDSHDINLTTKRGRLYSPPVKAFIDLALRPRRKPQPVEPAAA